MSIRTVKLAAALAAILFLPLSRAQSYGPEHPEWTTPIAPFRIADNLYYVGSKDLASYLIVTPAGDILINSNLTSSPPLSTTGTSLSITMYCAPVIRLTSALPASWSK
jgi:hypothetical protein